MSLTLSTRNTILPTLFSGTVYIALHTGSPGDTATANELSGGGYARQPATFSMNSSNGSATLTAGIKFTLGASATLTHISMWPSATGGTAINSQPLTAPVAVTSGTFTIAAGDITIGGPA